MYKNKTIGPYEIIAELGRGGMAVVYQATDLHSGRNVALKLLMPQFAEDTLFLKRFVKEGQNTKRLRHPNIVRTYDAGQADGHYYIAMELIDGMTLADYVQQSGALLSTKESFDILSQIAGALDYAHSLGFLHRDIKLTNILICADGRALLSDFGAAKHMSSDYTMITATGQSIGTPSYMSPEQARADINLDCRTDVYSLGVVAYKLFTGRMPFTADSQPELLFKIVYEEPKDPVTVNEDIPEPIANVLRRVLSKQPELRYESAGTFISALVATKRWRIKEPDKVTESPSVTPVPEVDKNQRWSGLRLALAVLSGVMLLLVTSTIWRETPDLAFWYASMQEADFTFQRDSFLNSIRVQENAGIVANPMNSPAANDEKQVDLVSKALGVSDSLAEFWTSSGAQISDIGDILRQQGLKLGVDGLSESVEDWMPFFVPAHLKPELTSGGRSANNGELSALKPPLHAIVPRLPKR